MRYHKTRMFYKNQHRKYMPNEMREEENQPDETCEKQYNIQQIVLKNNK